RQVELGHRLGSLLDRASSLRHLIEQMMLEGRWVAVPDEAAGLRTEALRISGIASRLKTDILGIDLADRMTDFARQIEVAVKVSAIRAVLHGGFKTLQSARQEKLADFDRFLAHKKQSGNAFLEFRDRASDPAYYELVR